MQSTAAHTWGPWTLLVGGLAAVFSLQSISTELPAVPEGLGAAVLLGLVAAHVFPGGGAAVVGVAASLGFGLVRWLDEPVLVSAALGAILVLSGGQRAGRYCQALTCVLLVTVCYDLLGVVPMLGRWQHDLDEATRVATSALLLPGSRVGLSAAYAGIPVLLGALAGRLVAKGGVTLGRCTVYGVLAVGLWWFAVQLPIWLGVPVQKAVQWIPVLAALVFLGTTTWALRRSSPQTIGRVRNSIVPVLASLMIALLATRTFASWEARGSQDARVTEVVVLDAGLQDWDVPRDGEYGTWSGGMFGLLPRYADNHGVALRTISRSALRPEQLSTASLLMIINLNLYLEPSELQAVRQWVHAGGTCAVLGDHTNVAGIMGPTNKLIAPHGVELRFDSAKSFHAWTRSFLPSGAAWLAGARREGFLPYGVGASLRLSGGAEPLLRARHGFSDAGIRENVIGAHLGNYRVDIGEAVGDMTLIARAPHGEGEFVVFGDTSSFQNGALPDCANGWGFFERFLQGRPNSAPWWVLIGGLVLGSGLVALLVQHPRAGRLLVGGVGIGLPILIWALDAAGSPPSRLEAMACTFIQQGVVEGWSERPTDTGSWSIPRSAERAGFFTVRARGVSQAARRGVLAFVLPVERIDGQGDVLRAVHEGAEVLIVGGPLHARAVDRILDAANLQVLDLPLGPLPRLAAADRSLEHPSFPSAFEIVHPSDENTTTLARMSGKTVAVRRKLGEGHVTLIADSAFPRTGNVEGANSWHLGNLTFLSRYWQLVKAGLSVDR